MLLYSSHLRYKALQIAIWGVSNTKMVSETSVYPYMLVISCLHCAANPRSATPCSPSSHSTSPRSSLSIAGPPLATLRIAHPATMLSTDQQTHHQHRIATRAACTAAATLDREAEAAGMGAMLAECHRRGTQDHP